MLKRTKKENETVRFLADALVANFPSHFSIFCGHCWIEAKAPRWHKNWQDLAVRKRAADRLYRAGWRRNSMPLCPKCAKENSN
jgi:hypothetical protein